MKRVMMRGRNRYKKESTGRKVERIGRMGRGSDEVSVKEEGERMVGK